MEKLLTEGLAELGLTPPAEAVEQLSRYCQLMLEQNKVMNLTSITDPAQVATLHFLDSAALLNCVALGGRSLVDVGTGAGFPGMVLKILEPTLSLTLVDSVAKRLTWLESVCHDLGLHDVTICHARAEEQALQPDWRDSFDFATARAVADLRVLCELCIPYVKPGGHFLAMKTMDCDQEISQAAHAIKLLGGQFSPLYPYHIPGTDIDRQVVVVKKTAPTPKGYPRRWSKMQKSPL